MAAKARDTISPRILAVVQTAGDASRVLVVQTDSPGLRFLDARTADGPVAPVLESIWAAHGRGRVVRIVPGASSVCRIGGAAVGTDTETIAALSLVGEALLPTDVPPHRRSAGVLPGASAPGAPASVLATAWVGAAPAPILPEPARAVEPSETWISQVGALAALAAPGNLVAYLDAAAHSIALLAAGPERTVARQLLGDSSNPAAWRASVHAAVEETALAAGFAGVEALNLPSYASGSTLLVSPQVRTTLRGSLKNAPTDDRWIDQYGLCLAAAVVATGPATLRPLAGLYASAPKIREATPFRAASWLTQGSRPRTIITIGLILLLLGPVGFAFARHRVLAAKSTRLEGEKTTREQTQRQAALYAQLDLSRWPVTKLLSDLSVATPVGVTAETVNLSTEMGLKFAGRADSQDLVNTLQANLNATKLFRNIKVGRTESLDGGGVGFDLTAEVVSPHNKVTSAEDFASKTLAVRLYGEGADNTKEAPVSDKSKNRRASRGDRAEEGGKEATATSRRGGEEGPPAALSDADIAKMDNGTAMKEWAKRRSYVQKNPTLDTENKDRLNSEVTKLREQMKKAQPASGGKP